MKIAVTTIEQFRRYCAGTTTLENLLSSIRGEFTPSQWMELGTAFHAILEEPSKYVVFCDQHGEATEHHAYLCDDLFFPAEAIEPCIDAMDYSGAFEVKTSKKYFVGSEEVTVVAKCDQLLGMTVIENKTRWGQFDYDGYAESCQWRFYLDIFNVEAVKYNVFCMNYTVSRGIELNSIETFTMHDYCDLQSDLQQLLSDFIYFINTQNLQHYFRDKYEYQNQ